MTSIAITIASTTAVVFIIAHGEYDSVKSINVFLILSGYAAFQFIELTAKVKTAEMITRRVRKRSNFLVQKMPRLLNKLCLGF